MLWLGILLGTVARSPDAVTGIVFIVIFPLTFVANAFVPAGTLPGVLRTFADWNPISSLVAGGAHAVRQPDGGPGRRRVAAAAPGRERAAVVRGAARGRRCRWPSRPTAGARRC